MTRIYFFALALCCTTAAQAQDARSTDYDMAVEARLAGDAARAAALLEPLIAANPRNSDAQVQLGLARMALGELDAAEAAFRAALTVAPGYTDAHVGLARVAQRRGDRAAALRALDAAGVQSAEIAELRNQLADASSGPRWQIDVDAAYSWLDGPQPDWRELAFQSRAAATRRRRRLLWRLLIASLADSVDFDVTFERRRGACFPSGPASLSLAELSLESITKCVTFSMGRASAIPTSFFCMALV